MPDGPTMKQTLDSMNKTKQGSGIHQHQHTPTESLALSFILSYMQITKCFIALISHLLAGIMHNNKIAYNLKYQ